MCIAKGAERCGKCFMGQQWLAFVRLADQQVPRQVHGGSSDQGFPLTSGCSQLFAQHNEDVQAVLPRICEVNGRDKNGSNTLQQTVRNLKINQASEPPRMPCQPSLNCKSLRAMLPKFFDTPEVSVCALRHGWL